MNSEKEALDPRTKLMDELLRQQDEAIEQLEQLDSEILSIIKSVTDRTKAENEAAAKKLEAIDGGMDSTTDARKNTDRQSSRAA
jgi:hypothetical protein